MKKFLFVGVVALAGLLLTSGDAKADRFRISFGSGCNSGFSGGGYYGGGYARRSAYSYPGYSLGSYRGWGGRSSSFRTWHDTSHLDYHPPAHVRHGNHYHVIPGHYDLHRTGHWDYHH